MSLRRLLPLPLRKSMAYRCVVRADSFFEFALVAERTGDLKHADRMRRLGMMHELRALQWWPVEHAGMVPLPGEEPHDHDHDDSPPPVDPARPDQEFTCVLCGEPIVGRWTHQPDDHVTGLYCDACRLM